MNEADILALFAPDKPAGRLLAEAIRDFPLVVTPNLLTGLVKSALAQFAKFVTKNPAAIYGSLTPQERNKANFAMAIASQGSHIAVASGFGVLLDPNGRSQSVGFGVSASERSFEMEIDHEGGLNVHFRSKDVPTMVVVDNVPTPCGAGSEVKMSLDLHVNAPEFNRLANLDFATYDDRPLFQATDRGNETDKFRKARNVLPPAFRFKIDVGPVVVANLK